jgi:hypothetical protein
MAAIMTIREEASGLILHVYEKRKLWAVALNLLVGPVVVYFFVRTAFSPKSETSVETGVFVGVLVAVAMVSSLASNIRGTDVTLHINNLDFVSTHGPFSVWLSAVDCLQSRYS